MSAYPLTTLAVVLVLLVYFWTSARVGGARTKFGVAAPATIGHPEFERHYRVQMNTLETLVLLLPALFLALPSFGDAVAALIALAYALGRVIYALAYVRDPAKRSLGFGISIFAVLIAVGGAIWSGVRALI